MQCQSCAIDVTRSSNSLLSVNSNVATVFLARVDIFFLKGRVEKVLALCNLEISAFSAAKSRLIYQRKRVRALFLGYSMVHDIKEANGSTGLEDVLSNGVVAIGEIRKINDRDFVGHDESENKQEN